MTFKKKGRPTWYVWPTLPGFGRVGPWSTGSRTKALADAVEAWLLQTAISDPEAVRGIVEGHYGLVEAYVAWKERRLDELKQRRTDPLLAEVVEQYRPQVRDGRKLAGLDELLELAPKAARFSWLAHSRHITDTLNRQEAKGFRRNSVHRSLYAAIKGLLGYRLGNAEKLRICADVDFTYEDDTRHVDATPEQLAALLAACDVELREVATAAVLTGIDRRPLTLLTPAHFDFAKGTVRVPDTKAQSRYRVFELSEAAVAHFRRLCSTKQPGERLFRITETAITQRWLATRRALGLDVRFKDLRHVFANAWVDEGGSIDSLGGVLGHTKKGTTLKYTARQAKEARARMDRVAERLGLSHQHLRIEKGGEAL